MADQHLSQDGQSQKRPPHLSIASLGTNASGIADSTISYAGSDFSGISQFPAPPSEIPTPPLPNVGTPTSYSFIPRLPPSIPSYDSPTRFRFGTPPSPRSPAAAYYPGNFSVQDAGSVKSGSSSRSGGSNATTKTKQAPVSKVGIRSEHTAEKQPPSPLSSLSSQPSTIYQPTRRLAYQNKFAPHPPISERVLEKRPETPHSAAGASSLLDWSDATSGISIDPIEERLLTTSFITSLLAQSSDPFPRERPHKTRSRAIAGPDRRKNDEAYLGLTSDEANHSSSPHQSIPPFYPSDLLSANGREAFNSRAMESGDRRSVLSDSRRASKDYSEALHSDEQLQAAIRRPSITLSRAGIEVHPVGVMHAVRIVSNAQKCDDTNRSLMASIHSAPASMASKPPVHRADAPQSVHHASGFDGDGVLRESDEDFVKIGSPGFYQEGMETGDLYALPSTEDSPRRSAEARSRSRSRVNRPSSPKHPLQRNQSMKSVVSSLISRISHSSAIRRAKDMTWWRQRPLPPLPRDINPPPEFPNGKEIQQTEEAIPLPTLAKRADAVSGMLDRGNFPSGANDRRSEFCYKEAALPDEDLQLYDRGAYVQFDRRPAEGRSQRGSLFSRFRERKEEHPTPSAESPTAAKMSASEERRKRRRLWTVAIIVVIGIVFAIAVPVGLSQRKSSMPVCKGNQTGASCTLDATCICTGNGVSCKPLARSMFLLVPDVNGLVAANFTSESLSDAVVNTVGVSPDGLCTDQALLIDVEPGLNSAAAPNRTTWAQAAMLWNLGMSSDIGAATTLQKFVSTAPWNSLPSVDGPVDDTSRKFSRNVSGFTFDFAAQAISPLSASFTDSSPSQGQLQEVSVTTEQVLDRMYSFAIASSTQREKALVNYWTSVLQRQASELVAFRDAVRNSPFLIPFDATSSPGGEHLTSLMGNSSSTQFPVPISCYPGLDESQLARINTLETTVFGLDPASSTSSFSQDCFPSRPTYGVVDLLRLRLPFPDDRKGVALQASALSTDATIRAVVYAGEVLSALPGSTAIPNITSATTDPREFGTANFLDHVLLNYLSSIPNVTLATDLVSHVLSSSIPTNGSALASTLSSLPVLEFAVFGSVKPQDIAFSVSSFSTPTGSLFFGSDAGETFRSWALVNTSASIAWAEFAISSDVVHEGSTTDAEFESVWKPASELVASGSTDSSDVEKVTSSLRSLGLFSP